MSTPERLYGEPGAEHLSDDPATVYETHEDYWTPPGPWSIEEWTIRPQRTFLPTPEAVLERLVEEVEEVDEDGAEAWVEASQNVEVLAAVETALVKLAQKVPYFQAWKLVTVHEITFDAEGKPLLDGEPLYHPAATPEPGDLLVLQDGQEIQTKVVGSTEPFVRETGFEVPE